jgi:hypothetical protein
MSVVTAMLVPWPAELSCESERFVLAETAAQMKTAAVLLTVDNHQRLWIKYPNFPGASDF